MIYAEFLEVHHLNIASSDMPCCLVCTYVFTEELPLVDNLINEQSICSSAWQKIQDCRNRLHQPRGGTQLVNPT